MNVNNIGRNDPCPCGSGKKFKKCCMNKPDQLAKISESDNEKNLPDIKTIDYGAPAVTNDFLDTQNFKEYSSQRFIYSDMLMPELEELVSKSFHELFIGAASERELIQNTDSAEGLIKIMRSDPEATNQALLRNKILELEKDTIPLIFSELKKPQNVSFYELAVRIIKKSGVDYAEEVIDIIENYQRDAYAVSILSLLLGFYKDRNKSVALLWKLSHYFREYYPGKAYADGPLFALQEMRARDREAIANQKQN